MNMRLALMSTVLFAAAMTSCKFLKSQGSQLKSGCEDGANPEMCDDAALRAVEAEVRRIWNANKRITIEHFYSRNEQEPGDRGPVFVTESFGEIYDLDIVDVRIGGDFVRVTLAGTVSMGGQGQSSTTIKMDFAEKAELDAYGWHLLNPVPSTFTTDGHPIWNKTFTYVPYGSMARIRAGALGFSSQPEMFKKLAGEKFIEVYKEAIKASGWGN